jgi:transposase
VDERIKFIADILRGDHIMTELCQIYNISRKTGYKRIERFQESGASGLEELDRRPQNCPHATPDRIVKQILELRFKHPTGVYPLVLRKITYGDEFEVRTVRKEGDIKWQGANIFISELLRHESVGLRQMEGDL